MDDQQQTITAVIALVSGALKELQGLHTTWEDSRRCLAIEERIRRALQGLETLKEKEPDRTELAGNNTE